MTTALIASSDARLRGNLGGLLRSEGFDVLEAVDGLEAFRVVFASQPDAAVVDLSIQAVDGLELVRMLRAASDLAILALLTPGDPSRGVAVLEVGADDVIRPATPPAEFVARLKASVRRSQRSQRAETPQANVVRTGDLVIDRQTHGVTKGGNPVRLSRTEYRLLDALASRAGQVAPHRYLLSTVWGEEYVDDTHYLRVYIGYLRAKLEDDVGKPRYILSEWGVGYRLAIVNGEEPARDRRRFAAEPAPEPAASERPLNDS